MTSSSVMMMRSATTMLSTGTTREAKINASTMRSQPLARRSSSSIVLLPPTASALGASRIALGDDDGRD